MKEAGVDSVPRSTWWSRSGVIGLKFVLPEFPQLVLVVLVDHPGGDANSEGEFTVHPKENRIL